MARFARQGIKAPIKYDSGYSGFPSAMKPKSIVTVTLKSRSHPILRLLSPAAAWLRFPLYQRNFARDADKRARTRSGAQWSRCTRLCSPARDSPCKKTPIASYDLRRLSPRIIEHPRYLGDRFPYMPTFPSPSTSTFFVSLPPSPSSLSLITLSLISLVPPFLRPPSATSFMP